MFLFSRGYGQSPAMHQAIQHRDTARSMSVQTIDLVQRGVAWKASARSMALAHPHSVKHVADDELKLIFGRSYLDCLKRGQERWPAESMLRLFIRLDEVVVLRTYRG